MSAPAAIERHLAKGFVPGGRKTPFPSSMGLSVLIPPTCRSIKATVTWGDYAAVMKDESVTGWRRTERWAQAPLPIPAQDTTRDAARLKDSGGLDLVLSVRTIPSHKGLDLVAPGTRAVSVFLVNNRNPMTGIRRDEAWIYMHQGVKGADHEAGADEQDQGERNLHHNKGLTGAMPFPALA